ncbi:hypothetical protein CYMTET_47396 [Cymbomonas tetramitiformis]|uniref:Uncharacterized protein n=1 Tax=Cymbomonas tetramitiformis TaxID=36881 RepID=A0AAE0BVN1_9CHLO|nr:hypothetical protein CYMTET_47396 [Cymbomonas tetramitiformis]
MSTEEQTSEPTHSGAAAAVTPPVNNFLLAFENLEEMERSDRDTDGPRKMDLKLSYTGSKDEDRATFIRHFVDYVERVKRSHESKVRRQIKTAAFQALITAEQKQALRDSKPDYRSIWDRIPSMLAGEDFATSPASEYKWWCAACEKEGMMASTAFRILKDTSVRDSFRGSVRCALPPFHEMKVGETWTVCRPFEENDVDEEASQEWLTEGTSTRGLTGIDSTADTHYFWALRAFVAELEAKFLMRGTKEKKDLLLVAKPQAVDQDGLAYVKLCMRREAAVHAGKMVADSMTRQNIEECIKPLRISEYKERVSKQLRVQFPAPTKVTWKDLVIIVEVQDKLKNDAESWALTLQQELTRRANCVYSCY